jgi:hypothetical protein
MELKTNDITEIVIDEIEILEDDQMPAIVGGAVCGCSICGGLACGAGCGGVACGF